MIIYKNFVENRCIDFLIKKEKVFIKYLEIVEKGISSKRNLIVNLFIVKSI